MGHDGSFSVMPHIYYDEARTRLYQETLFHIRRTPFSGCKGNFRNIKRNKYTQKANKKAIIVTKHSNLTTKTNYCIIFS